MMPKDFSSRDLIMKDLLLDECKQVDVRIMTDDKLMNLYQNCDDPLMRIDAQVQLEKRGYKF